MRSLTNGSVTDVELSDVNLQLDVIGDQIDFWVWDPDELMPEEPTISAQHGDITSGDFYIWGGGSFPDPKGPVMAAIRYVEVADLHILTGDFNRDGSLGINDVDALADAVRNNDSSLKHDVNNDEVTDKEDLRIWVKDLKRTWFGDANLDGEFGQLDLVNVLAAAKYGQGNVATWSEGDWNADGLFNQLDVVAALQDDGYLKGPQIAITVVPEPSSAALLFVGVALFALRRRR